MVILATPDGAATRADGRVREFTPGERVKRAVLVMLLAIALAATLIPIPIIHLLGIPMLLITGIVLSIRQLSLVARLVPLQLPCPKCHAANRVGGGLGLRNIAEPIERMCEGCRRGLTLRIELSGGD
jgi:hypothetical protein